VRRLIAERAGYRCSVPRCRRQTLGPGTGPWEVACIGVACHIYAAAPGGPRGAGGLTIGELQSPSNGIWLCADHARLIDANGGRGYPAPLLRGWRQLHEAFLIDEMRGLVPSCALITEVSFRKGPAALTARPVALSRLNVVVGMNESGKSILLDLLAGAVRKGPLSQRPWHGDLDAAVHWFDPQPHTIRLQAHDSGIELCHEPGRAMYRTVTVRRPMQPVAGLRGWASLLGLDSRSFTDLLFEVPERVAGEVSRVELINGVPVAYLRSIPEPVHLDESPSPGSAWIVLFESAIALAQSCAQSAPTLLLIDDFGDYLHPHLAEKMLALLARVTTGIQTIVVTHHVIQPKVLQDWSITCIGADDYDTLTGGTPPYRFDELETALDDHLREISRTHLQAPLPPARSRNLYCGIQVRGRLACVLAAGHLCWAGAVWQQPAADRCFTWLFGCGDAYGVCLDEHCLVQAWGAET
jgi:hypothetical protein